MAWIDYQKAFDSVSYRWIIKCVELIGISIKVISFTKKAVSYWKTDGRLYAEETRKERGKRYRNIMWNVSRKLIVSPVTLH